MSKHKESWVLKAPEALPQIDEVAFYVGQGVTLAKAHIEKQYHSSRLRQKDRDNRLFYHEEWHTDGVTSRGRDIAKAMHAADPEHFSEKDIFLTMLAGGFHDTVQNWDFDHEQQEDATLHKVPLKRKRETGDNERESAKAALFYMREVNNVAGHDVFTKEDMGKVKEAIMLTIPDGWDGNTVYAKGFADARPVAQAVALADLGGSGMQGPEIAYYESLALFAEENLDFRRDADRLLHPSRRFTSRARDQKMENWYKERFLQWIDRQEDFVKGRKNRIRGEIAKLPVSMRASVNALFKDVNYDSSIVTVRKLHGDYEKKDYQRLVEDMFATLQYPPVPLG